METLIKLKLQENTLVLFNSDNGPRLSRGLSAGSEIIFTCRYVGYYDAGKVTTWEGGIRMLDLASWKGAIPPFSSRSSEIASSLGVFPTLSSLAGILLQMSESTTEEIRCKYCWAVTPSMTFILFWNL